MIAFAIAYSRHVLHSSYPCARLYPRLHQPRLPRPRGTRTPPIGQLARVHPLASNPYAITHMQPLSQHRTCPRPKPRKSLITKLPNKRSGQEVYLLRGKQRQHRRVPSPPPWGPPVQRFPTSPTSVRNDVPLRYHRSRNVPRNWRREKKDKPAAQAV